MFKKYLQLGAFTGALLMATAAHAVPIVDTLNVDTFVNWFESHSYTHDLNDDGFTPGTTIAESGTIEIQFSDDQDNWLEGSWEVLLIVVDEFDFDTGGIILSATSFSNSLEVEALAEINSSGTLDITIQSLWGDFWIGESVLTVFTAPTVGIAGVAKVPEPRILGILGLGLFGIGAARRIRKARGIR